MALFNHKNHQELWDWLVHNPTRNVWDWPVWEASRSVGGAQKAVLFSFACQYDHDERKERGFKDKCCTYCPFERIDNSRLCANNGLFTKWAKCSDVEEKIKYAKQIRDLPMKPEVYSIEKFGC